MDAASAGVAMQVGEGLGVLAEDQKAVKETRVEVAWTGEEGEALMEGVSNLLLGALSGASMAVEALREAA